MEFITLDFFYSALVTLFGAPSVGHVNKDLMFSFPTSSGLKRITGGLGDARCSSSFIKTSKLKRFHFSRWFLDILIYFAHMSQVRSPKHWPIGILTGLSYINMVAAWGGAAKKRLDGGITLEPQKYEKVDGFERDDNPTATRSFLERETVLLMFGFGFGFAGWIFWG